MNDEVKVLDMTHADEVIREVDGGIAPTMQSRMGTGGNQVPLVMGVFNQQGSKGTGHASTEDTSPTLGHCNTSVDVHAVAIDQQGGKGAASFATDIAPTMAGDSHGTPHAVAVRTANTHANGHGVADEATHTLDRASGQAVCVGFSHVASGMMLDSQPSPTSIPLKRSPGGEGAVCIGVNNQGGAAPQFTENTSGTLVAASNSSGNNLHGVAIGFKAGQSANGGLGEEAEVSPTMSHQPSALEPTVAVGIDPYNAADTGDAAATLGVNAGVSTGRNGVALRHIVRRLTPTECARLQGFPDQWCRIPMGKWRRIDEAERDYLLSQGAWVQPHIRVRAGRIETDLAPDSPMYRCDGNSWATNCAEWILRRIVAAIRLGLIQ